MEKSIRARERLNIRDCDMLEMPDCQKPKWMRWRTHKRQVEIIQECLDIQLIVTSANASNNGIGFLNTAALIEAGSFHSPNSKAFRSAAGWFERLWKRANVVDNPALDLAQKAWDRRQRSSVASGIGSFQPASLIGSVVADPSRFRGVGFAFTNTTATTADRDRAAKAIVEDKVGLELQHVRRIKCWPVGDVFSGWLIEDVAAWPGLFVCAHRSRRRLSYSFCKRDYTTTLDGKGEAEDNDETVLASRSHGLRKRLGFTYGAAAMALADDPLVNRIFNTWKAITTSAGYARAARSWCSCL